MFSMALKMILKHNKENSSNLQISILFLFRLKHAVVRSRSIRINRLYAVIVFLSFAVMFELKSNHHEK